MHRRTFLAPAWRRRAAGTGLGLLLATACAGAAAQAAARAEPPSLRQAYEAAWARQPEAAALATRRDAARAQLQAARAWTPEPVALQLAAQSDRLNRRLGAREYEAGVALPLWLPGERGRSQALAQAEGQAVESRATVAQLRVAAAVRDAWWQWQRARAEAAGARAQLNHTRQLAADVGRRLQAGDLARADQHQADGAVAAAVAALAQAEAALATAGQRLRALGAASDPGPEGEFGPDAALAGAEAVPDATPPLDGHVELVALRDRLAVASGTAALAATQSRAHPELTLGTTRERGVYGEAWQQSLTLGLRIPFGDGPRHDARRAAAQADTIELQAQLELERARLAGERESARARHDAARQQLDAAQRRAQLAGESRGFFDRAFRLGETDLPTRLRIEAEAAEADRQAALAHIELAAAVSAWRQALGLLPQ